MTNRSRTNVGVYVDLEGDVTKQFFVDAAGRFERYSDFGSTLNGKLGLRYKVTDAFALRGSVSTGFRAPSLAQKYFNSTFTKNVSLSVGGSNILNIYPNKFQPALTESDGAWDPVQMGSNGAFFFTRLGLRF